MAIGTIDIPQADLIWDVARVPEAIAQGQTTPEAIAIFLGNKVRRQGYYYAQAAVTLGLAGYGDDGDFVLTAYGRAFMDYSRAEKLRALRRLVLEREPTRSLVIRLRAVGGMSRRGLGHTIQAMAPLANSTALRRAQTIERWLCELGLVTKQQGQLVFRAPTPQGPAAVQRKAA